MLLVFGQQFEARANNLPEVEISPRISALKVFVAQASRGLDRLPSAKLRSDSAQVPEHAVEPPKEVANESLQTENDGSERENKASQLAEQIETLPDKSISDAHVAQMETPTDSLGLEQAVDSLAQLVGEPQPPKPHFVPNPTRALWLSLVLPGAGQIYNRKYWKLPIVYGGFLGCAYALMWNQQMYKDYSQAYLDIMDDDPNTASYMEMLPPNYDISGREEQFQTIFKRKKNYYRRYRDLSAFCFIGVYLISVIDAYVDAHLSEFDISPDLTMRVEPTVIGNPTNRTSGGSSAYGVGCSLSF